MSPYTTRLVKHIARTYFEGSKELIEIDCAVLVSVEVVEELLSLLLGEVEPIVYESPSEVIHIQLSISGVVHCFENAGNSFDTS